MAAGQRDHDQAGHEQAAREHLLSAGAAGIPRPPWRPGRQPPPAVDLIQYALWRARAGDAVPGPLDPGMLSAALALLPAARAEVDQLEAALLFIARAHGMSWARISHALGLGSPQGAQQRSDRVTGRVAPQTGS